MSWLSVTRRPGGGGHRRGGKSGNTRRGKKDKGYKREKRRGMMTGLVSLTS